MFISLQKGNNPPERSDSREPGFGIAMLASFGHTTTFFSLLSDVVRQTEVSSLV